LPLIWAYVPGFAIPAGAKTTPAVILTGSGPIGLSLPIRVPDIGGIGLAGPPARSHALQ
jgi:hypothetical protein